MGFELFSTRGKAPVWGRELLFYRTLIFSLLFLVGFQAHVYLISLIPDVLVLNTEGRCFMFFMLRGGPFKKSTPPPLPEIV